MNIKYPNKEVLNYPKVYINQQFKENMISEYELKDKNWLCPNQ